MSALTTIKELQNMTPVDLRKEIAAQDTLVVKLRLGVKLGKEKDSAKYVRERKQLARMKTVLAQKSIEKESAVSSSKETKTSVSSRRKK